MRLKKSIILRCIQGCINQYQGKDWYVKDKVKYKKAFDKINYFDVNTVEGHFGEINGQQKTLYIVFEGSDSKKDHGKDWIGKLGNFNFFAKLIPRKEPITYKVYTPIKVHAGHLRAWWAVKDLITEKTKKYDVIYVSGHSRGDAIAQICAENLGFHNCKNKKIFYVGLSGNKVFNRYGVESLAKHTEDYLKMYMRRDIVPGMPPFGKLVHPLRTKVFNTTGGLPDWLRLLNPVTWFMDHKPTVLQREAKKQL